MEPPFPEIKKIGDATTQISVSGASSATHQLFNPESLDLPDDTFRMSLDNFSIIGENVTVGSRLTSNNSMSSSSIETPVPPLPTPDIDTPEPDTPITPSTEKCQGITEPSKQLEKDTPDCSKPQNLLKLSFMKKDDTDLFVKPSPIAEIMSPAKMLQFEIDNTISATPTMKRAAVEFDFFAKNNFEEYFEDVPKAKEEENFEKSNVEEKAFEQTPVIVKANTIRHEIGYECRL